MTFRSQALLKAAHRFPLRALCGKHGYTVAAHSNELRHGRGIGHKAPDFKTAYLCGDPGGCHDLVDGRAGKLTKDEKRAMWREAHERTVALWFEYGVVQVRG